MVELGGLSVSGTERALTFFNPSSTDHILQGAKYEGRDGRIREVYANRSDQIDR